MNYSPHQLAYFALKLTLRCPAMDRMAGALLDAQVNLNPHQIDAALFATSNPLSRGVILVPTNATPSGRQQVGLFDDRGS